MTKEKKKSKNIRELREENEGEEIICILEINENLRRIKNNQALTRPLRTLNNNCEFIKRYNLMFEDERQKEYNKKPEVKQRVKEYNKKYNQRPEVKQRVKEYYQNNRKEILKKMKEDYNARKFKTKKK